MSEIDYSLLSPEARELRTVMDFGQQVENFLASPVGRYLAKRAEAERTEALEALAEVAPGAIEQIRQLQMVVKRADSFAQWLADAAMDGESAKEQLDLLGRE